MSRVLTNQGAAPSINQTDDAVQTSRKQQVGVFGMPNEFDDAGRLLVRLSLHLRWDIPKADSATQRASHDKAHRCVWTERDGLYRTLLLRLGDALAGQGTQRLPHNPR